nr:immunoglobulin light chain junction region [Macaca mulatta]
CSAWNTSLSILF